MTAYFIRKAILVFAFIFFQIGSGKAQFAFYTGNKIIGERGNAIFVYRDSDKDYLEELSATLKSNWDHCNLELISYDEYLGRTLQENELVFLIATNYEEALKTKSEGSFIVLFDLYLFQKQVEALVPLAVAGLFTKMSATTDLILEKKTVAQSISDQYKVNEIYNWNICYLATALKYFSDVIEMELKPTEGEAKAVSSITNPELNKLKTGKLYVSDAVEFDLKLVKGTEIQENKDKLFNKAYGYDFEVISNEKIRTMITNKESGYLLLYQRSSSVHQYFMIVKMETLEVIYAREETGYILEDDYLSRIKRAIDRALK